MGRRRGEREPDGAQAPDSQSPRGPHTPCERFPGVRLPVAAGGSRSSPAQRLAGAQGLLYRTRYGEWRGSCGRGRGRRTNVGRCVAQRGEPRAGNAAGPCCNRVPPAPALMPRAAAPPDLPRRGCLRGPRPTAIRPPPSRGMTGRTPAGWCTRSRPLWRLSPGGCVCSAPRRRTSSLRCRAGSRPVGGGAGVARCSSCLAVPCRRTAGRWAAGRGCAPVPAAASDVPAAGRGPQVLGQPLSAVGQCVRTVVAALKLPAVHPAL